MPQSIEDSFIKHQIYLNRYSSSLYKEALPELTKMSDEIIAKLSKSDITAFSSARLKQQLAEIKLIIDTTINGAINPKLFEDLALYESEFSLKVLDGATPASVIVSGGINASVLLPEVMASTMQLQGVKGKQTIEDVIKTFSDAHYKDIESEIRRGIAEGLTTDDIVKKIQYLSNNRTRQQASSVVRTLTNHIATTARSETFKEYDHLFIGEKFLATLDSRVSLQCSCRDLAIYSFDGKPINAIAKANTYRRPALHYNCLTGDTLISSRYPISYISRRSYQGSLYIINTSRGNKITCTPNHPILTDRGFIAIKDINKLDKIATDTISHGIRFSDCQNSKGVSTIENLFTSLSESSGVSTETVPISSEDFHGDITDNKINIINMNRDLFFKGYPPRSEIISKFSLVNTSSSTSTIRHLNERFNCWSICFHSFMSTFNLISSLFLSHESPLDRFLFTLCSKVNTLSLKFRNKKLNWNIKPFCNSSNSDTVSIQSDTSFKADSPINPFIEIERDSSIINNNFFNGSVSDTELFTNILNGTNGDKVFFDDIIDITITENNFTHVYNLENDLGYYTANNLITHNCRSILVPELKPEYDLNIDSTRSSEFGQISDKISYSEWLKKQSNSFIYDVLGKKRGDMFIKGDITLNKFIDKKGSVLTLDELRKKEL